MKHTGWYDTSTGNRLFLLGLEEVHYGYRDNATAQPYVDNATVYTNSPSTYWATTGTAAMRTSGDHVLFGDANARKANMIGDTTASSDHWWLRSPARHNDTERASLVNATNGDLISSVVYSSHGGRPACWLNPGP